MASLMLLKGSVKFAIFVLYFIKKGNEMVRILDVKAVLSIVHKCGLNNFLNLLIDRIKHDFSNWEKFDKIPRPAFHVPDGVIELMPVCNDEKFAFKYVTGHPKNPDLKRQTVVATGQLSNVLDGYPLLLSEMTLLTALRTAATSALASDYMARDDAKVLAIIGTGAQSEYQVIAHKLIRNIEEVRFFDVDRQAMDKFEKNMNTNMAGQIVKLSPCKNAKQAVDGADIIIVCTACKAHAKVIKDEWIVDGQHINGLGGDCPGKTEIEASLLKRATVVVEFFEQAIIEGDIQQFSKEEAASIVHAHFHEIILNKKQARTDQKQITIFDGIGIALEDFSALNLINKLANEYGEGITTEMVPDILDPKDLFSVMLR